MKKIGLIILVFIFSFSCKKKEETRWNIDLLGPIIKSTLTIDDILPDSIKSINADNSVNIDYIFPFSPLTESLLLDIPDTTSVKVFPIPFSSSTTLPAGFQFVSNSSENELDLGNARLEIMKIKTGKVHYKITSQINEKTIFTYRILKTDDGNGNEFVQNISVPAGTVSSPAVVTGNLILNNYTFDLTSSYGTKYNTFETKISITVDPAGSPVVVSNLDSVFIENSLTDIEPEYVKGYIGTSDFSEGPTTNNFSVIDKIVDGTIDLDDVDISIKIKNFVGAEAQLKFAQFSSVNTRTATTVNLGGSVMNSWINLNRGIDNSGTVTPAEQSIFFTKANSNIDLFLENLPNKYISKIDAKINPLGNVSGGNDFIYFDKIIEADFHVKIPLKFIANNFTLQDTVDLNVNKDDNAVKYGDLTIYVSNGFPLDAEIQLYIMDKHNVVMDSIAQNGHLNSAQVDANNKVTNPTKSTLKFHIPRYKMVMLEKKSKVLLKVKFNTSSAPHTTIYKDYKMEIQLVGDFNMDVTYK